MKKNDRIGVDLSTLFTQSDFSAQPNFIPQDGGNCAKHGVCVLDCFVLLHSPREVTGMVAGVEVTKVVYKCDHVRVVSPSTGKNKCQDWFLHCMVLDFLIRHYKKIIPTTNISLSKYFPLTRPIFSISARWPFTVLLARGF